MLKIARFLASRKNTAIFNFICFKSTAPRECTDSSDVVAANCPRRETGTARCTLGHRGWQQDFHFWRQRWHNAFQRFARARHWCVASRIFDVRSPTWLIKIF
jgi:hypothetical protein